MNSLFRQVLIGAVGIASFATLTQAATITVPGGDFENVTAGPSSSSVGQINNGSPNWVGTAGPNGGTMGVFEVLGQTPGGDTNPNFGTFFNGVDLSANGYYVGFTQGIGTRYTNTLTDTYQANTTYTVSALVGHSYEAAAGSYTLQLEDVTTGTPLAIATGTFPGSDAVTATASFSTNDILGLTAVGHGIRIAYVSGAAGSQTFDNVTLTSSPVPEPASLGLMMVAGAGLALRRRQA